MSRYLALDGVEVKKICGEFFLVSHRNAWDRCPVIFRINETAALLWEHLAKRENEAQLIAVLQETFPVDAEQAAEDVQQFCESLCRYGYCEKVEEPDV